MSDTDVPLHEYLKEVLGYLQILGKNLQKRTKNLSENKINEKYLDSPENLKKTSDKIDLICNLSKASIDKVQNGVKKAIDSYIQKSACKTDVSPTKSASKSSRETTVFKDGTSKSDSSPAKELGPEKSNPVEDSKQEALSTQDSTSDKDKICTKIHRDDNGLEWIKYQKRKLFLPAHINLDEYFNCSVKVVAFHKDIFNKHKVANVNSIVTEKVYTEDDASYNTNKSRTKPKLPKSREGVRSNCSSHQDKKKKLEISDLEEIKEPVVDRKRDDKPLEKSSSDRNKCSKIKHLDNQEQKRKFKRVVLQESSDSDNDCLNSTVTVQHGVSPNGEENLNSSNWVTQNDNLTTEALAKCTEITTQMEVEENHSTFPNRDQCTDKSLGEGPSSAIQDKKVEDNCIITRNEEPDDSNIKPHDSGMLNERSEESSGEQELGNKTAENKCKKLETIDKGDNKSESTVEKNIANDLLQKSQDKEKVSGDGVSSKESSDLENKKLPVDNSADKSNLNIVDDPITSLERKKGNESEDRASDLGDTDDSPINSKSRDEVRTDSDKRKSRLLPDLENKKKSEDSNEHIDTQNNQISEVTAGELPTCSRNKESDSDDDRVSELGDTDDSQSNSKSEGKICIDSDKRESRLLPDLKKKKKSKEKNEHIDTEHNQVSEDIVGESPTYSPDKESDSNDDRVSEHGDTDDSPTTSKSRDEVRTDSDKRKSHLLPDLKKKKKSKKKNKHINTESNQLSEDIVGELPTYSPDKESDSNDDRVSEHGDTDDSPTNSKSGDKVRTDSDKRKSRLLPDLKKKKKSKEKNEHIDTESNQVSEDIVGESPTCSRDKESDSNDDKVSELGDTDDSPKNSKSKDEVRTDSDKRKSRLLPDLKKKKKSKETNEHIDIESNQVSEDIVGESPTNSPDKESDSNDDRVSEHGDTDDSPTNSKSGDKVRTDSDKRKSRLLPDLKKKKKSKEKNEHIDTESNQVSEDIVGESPTYSRDKESDSNDDKVSELGDTDDSPKNSKSKDEVRTDSDKRKSRLLPDLKKKKKKKSKEKNEHIDIESNQVSEVTVGESPTCSRDKESDSNDDRVSELGDTDDSPTNSKSRDEVRTDNDKRKSRLLPDLKKKKKSKEKNEHIDIESDQISEVTVGELPTHSRDEELISDNKDKQKDLSTDSENGKQLSDLSSVVETVLPISESVERVSLGSDEHCQLPDTNDKYSALPVSESTEQIGQSQSETETCPQSTAEESVTAEPQQKTFIRCVNIANLLAPDSVVSQPEKKNELLPQINIVKPRKIVTFLDKPIEILSSPEKIVDRRKKIPAKSPPSILLKGKEKNKTKSKNILHSQEKTNDISSDSDSDVSNATQELFKRIKLDILDGRCRAVVKLPREPLASWAYAESLAKYGIKKVYNELGELYSDKAKSKSVDMSNEDSKRTDSSGTICSDAVRDELNEKAKLSVLNSSSSSDSGDAVNLNTIDKSKKKVTCSSSSVSDAKNPPSGHKKKKKFSKRRHKNREPLDSDAEIENILSLPKRKKERMRKSSEESPSDGPTRDGADEGNSESDEMGRSLRLKGRAEPAASPEQSKKERNTSHASSTSDKAADSLSKKSKENTLLDTLLNGDVVSPDRSASDVERSSESGTEPKESNSKATFSEKPMERIKNDLLDDTSSSARESPEKVNGKEKVADNDEDSNDSDKDIKNEKEDADSDSSSGIKKKSKGGSVIELDSVSESDSDEKPKKKKKKKSEQNGKNSDSEAQDDDNDKESDTDESEIFVPSRRKRKPKSKSSEDSSDSEKGKSKNKRRRIKKLSGDESSAGSGNSSGSDGENNKKGRKNIRALKKSSNLGSATRKAARKEKERVARIAERQKLYNESLFDESGRPEDVVQLDKVVLDFDPETKEPSISIDKGLVAKLKPHQANGIKFMWDACFESEKQIKEKDKGSGCILAHCMGLGKTLQVVTLVHTLLTHREQTKVERVLVVCPLSTVLNWVNEFKMWLEHANSEEEINIFELSRFKQNYERSYQLKEWLECGGVCILGYDMFRNLSADNSKKFKKAQLNTFQKALIDPGPHLVVCDEGHLLKNEKTSISQSMNRVKTLRRIVLTGTPLQNNLKEYYCMVQFVKPDLLGKYNEYLNRFVNPITNGQYTNSTEHDIRVMKRRSHVLHTMLEGAVQRRDYAVLAPFLPPKHEYVLFISLTEIQIKLYAHYLENYSRRPNPDRKTTPSLFADFQSLQRIWTHPLVLKANSERYELLQQKKRDKEEDDESEGSLADFIDDGEDETTTPQETSMSESEHSDASDSNKKVKDKKKGKHSKVKHKRVTRANAVNKMEEEEHEPEIAEMPDQPRSENPTEWWMSLCSEEELNAVRHSNKLLLLLDILKMCEAIGDKLLVFSQSLYSLDLIEQFLSKIDDATQKGTPDENLAGHIGSWSQGLDYFRLDGSTSCENRAIWCKAFNREDNPRARLFLISTRAGGLGINLFAANRVVIFDMSWNPSHDVQSIFRVYRFGQKKPCYIYRFLALGTMEEKIYERQVTKQAISKRVIDEQQIDRHYTESDLAELYIFCPVPEGQREVPKLPKDRLFADLLKQHDKIIYKYHEHDSLLENKEEETLTEEERKAAWDDYENEKTRPPPAIGGTNWLQGLQQQHQQQQMTMNALGAVLRQDYPTLSEQQIASMIPAILQQMYTNGDAGLMQKMNAMMSAQNSMMGYKYPQSTMLAPGMLGMNPASMGVPGVGGVVPGGLGGVGMRGAPMYQQSWQQQQQMQLQRLQQQQAMQANMKYYAGGLGSRDMVDMAALQQQQRALLMGAQGNLPQRGRPPKGPPKHTQEVVDLDSE